MKTRGRAREFGLTIGLGTPGRHNAITDVEGVRVGHVSIVKGDGPLVPGKGPVRTGVTAITPYGADTCTVGLSCGCFVLNGNGCFTGLDYIREFGLLESPILLTNTLNLGTVYDATITWMLNLDREMGISTEPGLPVVGECNDGQLNDIRGRHVTSAHVMQALQKASQGEVREGSVGAGTGMVCYQYKGGIGTSSRILSKEEGQFTVGALVNCNFGRREQLRINGAHIGLKLKEHTPPWFSEGSACIVIATDAPLSSRQLERLSKRSALGLGRTGADAGEMSGNFIVAFSITRGSVKYKADETIPLLNTLPEVQTPHLNALFSAAAEATEEAVVNALFASDTMAGRDGNTAHGLPIEKVLELLKQQ